MERIWGFLKNVQESEDERSKRYIKSGSRIKMFRGAMTSTRSDGLVVSAVDSCLGRLQGWA